MNARTDRLPPTEARGPDPHARDACPAGCGRRVAVGHLLCGRCWREVPRELQREVYAAWRQLRAGRMGAVERYEAARDAALGSIR